MEQVKKIKLRGKRATSAAAAGSRSYSHEIQRLVASALAEDIGSGDVTANLFNADERGEAFFLAKEDGIASGMECVRAVFANLDPESRVKILVKDGQPFRRGDHLAEVRGRIRALLSGERVALNFLQQLSAIASLTRRYVDALGPSAAKRIHIIDTRKTTPLLRILEKAAVLHGGGQNNRMRLDDMAMLKNNHIDRAGGVREAVEALRASFARERRGKIPICIEARDLTEALAATEAGADIILLDNMPPRTAGECSRHIIERARQLRTKRPLIEVSGGLDTPQKAARYKDLPIDRLSVGALTHSAQALDISMRMKMPQGSATKAKK